MTNLNEIYSQHYLQLIDRLEAHTPVDPNSRARDWHGGRYMRIDIGVSPTLCWTNMYILRLEKVLIIDLLTRKVSHGSAPDDLCSWLELDDGHSD
jgi:hypothetical protein